MTKIMKPVRERILVETFPFEEKTSGGIYIPESSRDKPTEGIVRAVGSGEVTDSGACVPHEVRVGDKILFSKYSGTDIIVERKPFVVISAGDVLLILERDIEAPQYVPEVDAAKL